MGFYPGAPIPNGFGELTPVKRNTVKFAVGLTFRTAGFKKSSQNSANTSTATPPAGQGGGATTPKATAPQHPASGNNPGSDE